MGCGIYVIENVVNGKKYIGSSIQISTRLSKHRYALNGSYHDNRYLQNSFNKYGLDNFRFDILLLCDESELIEKENYYINLYQSNNLDLGFNLATVNEFRRNNYNDDVKIFNSKFGKELYGNFDKFKCVNLNNNSTLEFDNLVEAAIFIKENGFSTGKLRNIRQKISQCLREVKVNNGSGNNGAIRRTAYKHKWEVISK
jgi:hypothetical protein